MLTLARRFALMFGLLIGTLTSQLPEYAQQYRQRLGGALDELTRVIADFDGSAASEGLSRTAALDRLRQNADTLARNQALSLSETVARHDRLAAQDAAFAHAGPFDRLGLLVSDYDPGIARGAWARFEPAVPVTSEGFVLGGIGVLFGYVLWRTVATLFRRRMRPAASVRSA